jgi:phosphatidylglycerophosphate synthase
MTPNAVSVVALVLGAATGAVFVLGTRGALLAGGILFYLAFVVDCVDGKLARMLDVHSERGAALDHIGDTMRRTSASIGLTVWLWRTEGDATVLWGIVYTGIAYLFLELSGPETGARRWELIERRSAGTSGWRAFLARRRLLPNPGMPDVQAIAFILGPVTGFVVPALALALALLLVGTARHAYRLLR